jgi:nicotinate-nucleotide pyrophosphorylase (carboxylating)
MNEFALNSLIPQIKTWLDEDDLYRNYHYTRSLPDNEVKLYLKIKSPLILAGADYFVATFMALGESAAKFEFLRHWEGKRFNAGEVIEFPEAIAFNIALTGERLALNLLQHASSVATWTATHVERANKKNIRLLDTRKTTPGLRSIEKYAVRIGGAHNHRLGQTDSWMIKDNHKSCLGGLEGAWKFFQDQGTFYNSIIVEIHSLEELKEAIRLGIRHVMLDNFSPSQINEAVKLKKDGMTFEVSGGVKLDTLDEFLIEGVDAISMGSLVYSAPRVDISLKFKPHERL